MKSFLPNFTIATLTEEPARLRSKIGGIPWGFPTEKWPQCCDAPQKLLAQLCHEPPMLDLCGEDHVLYLFQCLECCGIGEDGRGAFVLDRHDLIDGPVTVPNYDKDPELGEALIGELFIDRWDMVDDGVPESRLPEFFEERRLWALQDEFDEIEWFDQMSRFGGAPRWTGNGPLDSPAPPWEFLFQLNTWLQISGNLPSTHEIGCSVRSEGLPIAAATQARTRLNAPWSVYRSFDSDHSSVEFTNLGSDGTLYVFIDRTSPMPTVQWYWNR